MDLQPIWIEMKPHVKGMAKVVAEKVIMESIEKAAAASENKIDDAMVAMLKPILMTELQKQIEQI